MNLIEQYVPKPWRERPDGFRLTDNLYLEFDRKFEWPSGDSEKEDDASDASSSLKSPKREVFCKALFKQIGVLSDGSHDRGIPASYRHRDTLPKLRIGIGQK